MSIETIAKVQEARKSGDHSKALAIAKAALKRSDDINLLIEYGLAASNLQRWDDAEEIWRRLTILVPQRMGPWDRLVTVYIETDRPELALAAIENVRELIELTDSMRLVHLRCLDALHRTEEADRLAAEIEGRIDETEEGARTCIALARRQQGQSNFDTAMALFNRAAEIDPGWPDPLVYLARLSTTLSRREDALNYWELVDRCPGGERFAQEYALFRARSAIATRDYDEAKDAFDQALDRGGEDTDILFEYFRFMWSFSNSGMQKALVRLNASVNSEHPLVCIAYAMKATRDGDLDEAHQLYRRAYDLAPHDRRTANAMGAFLSNNFASIEAVQFWRSVVVDAPTKLEPKVMLLRAIRTDDKHSHEIEQICSSILAQSPGNSEAMLQLGQWLVRVGRREEGLELFKEGIDLHPNNENFWTNRANELLNADKISEAITLVNQAEQAFETSYPSQAFRLAKILQSAEQIGRSQAVAQKALDQHPDDDDLKQFLMTSYMRTGHLASAKPLVDQIFTSNPHDVDAARASKTIASARAAVGTRSFARSKTPVPEAVFKAIAKSPSLIYPAYNSVTIVSSSLGAGGAERQVYYTLLGMDEIDSGFDSIDLVVRDLKSKGYDFFLEGVEDTGRIVASIDGDPTAKVVRDALARGDADPLHIAALESCGNEVARLAVPLYAYFVTQKPAVVHFWQDFVNVIGGYAALLAGVPRIVLSGRSTRPDARRRTRRWLQPGYQNLLKSPRISMLNNSSAGARDYQDWLKLPNGSIQTINNGLDIAAMLDRASGSAVSSIRDQLGVGPDTVLIGGVMRFSEEKRPDLYVDISIELCKAQPNVHSVLIGGGPLLGDVEERVASSGVGDRIHLVGPQRPVEPWMAAMDLLVLTSRMEGLPNVLLEAQALGTPVLSAQVGGAPEAIRVGETGELFEKDQNPKVVAKQIGDLLEDPGRLSDMGERAQAFINENFSIEMMARRTAEHYRDGLK